MKNKKIYIFVIMLSMISACESWSESRSASRPINIYPQIDESLPSIILPAGETCRINDHEYIGKLGSFYRISCENGIEGYIDGYDIRFFQPIINR